MSQSHIRLSIILLLCSVVLINGYKVRFQVWEDGPCKKHNYDADLDNQCWYFNYGKSSARILKGSCAILHRDARNCNSGTTYKLAYPYSDLCVLPSGWNDRLNSVTSCSSRRVSIRCPTGSYVRQMDYNPNAIQEGMTVKCYKPTESTPTLTRNTHGKTVTNSRSTSCPIAAHGLSVLYHTFWDMYYTPTMECSRSSLSLPVAPNLMVHKPNETLHSLDPTLSENLVRTVENYEVDNATAGLTTPPLRILGLCGSGEVFTGIDVTIDEADVIKALTFACVKVPDPATMCEPKESLNLVQQCDNSASGNVLICSYSQTKGVGLSKTLTETERKEYTFSQEVGFTFGTSLDYLSAEMSTKLGWSELVGYEWSQSDTTTWSLETTVSATMEVRPYTHSKLEQLVGKCTFYGTSVNFFKQTDVNVTTGDTSVRYFAASPRI